MPVLSVCSEKGGVGKTTIVGNLAALFGQGGRALAVDPDPQGSLTAAFGAEPSATPTLGDLLLDDDATDPRPAIIADVAPGVDLLPSVRATMEHAERHLTIEPAGAFALRERLAEIAGDYDWVLIDSPAALNILTTNAIAAADGVVGVFISQPWSMRGVGVVSAHVTKLHRRGLTTATFLGLVNNMYERRLVLTRAVNETVEASDLPVFDTRIPRWVNIAMAAGAYQPVVLADPDSGSARVFHQLRDELVTRVQGADLVGTTGE